MVNVKQSESRSMSERHGSDMEFKNEMESARTTLNPETLKYRPASCLCYVNPPRVVVILILSNPKTFECH